jgi:cyanophycinase
MSRFAIVRATVVVSLLVTAAHIARAQQGPAHGTLVISGGAEKPGIILERFIQLAGGADAPIIVVPTSGNADTYDQTYAGLKRFRDAGARNLFVLHTRDRNVANSDAFVKPIQTARGIWFEGGEHWKHADAYLDTKVQREVVALLDRGGVVGGGSAGGHIQSDYMEVSRNPEQEFAGRTLPRDEWRRGFQLVKNVAIDVHVLARNRQFDLVGVIQAHPTMLGIGIDENTAIVVQGDQFDVIGTSLVTIVDNQHQLGHDGPETFRTVGGLFYFLKPGDHYNLKTREPSRPGAAGASAFARVIAQPWTPPGRP